MHRINDMPGPGAYDSSINPIKESAPGVKMGQAPRGSTVKGDIPGPGQYNPETGKAGGVRFGKEERSGKNGNADMPGPGQYAS